MDRAYEAVLEEFREQGLNKSSQLFEVFNKATKVTTHVPGDMISGFLNPKDYDIKYVGPNVPGILTGEPEAELEDVVGDAEAKAKQIIADAQSKADKLLSDAQAAAASVATPANVVPPVVDAAPVDSGVAPADLAGFEALQWQKAGKLIREQVTDVNLLNQLATSTKDFVKNPAVEKLAALAAAAPDQ